MGGERRRARGGGGERERAGLRHRWGFEGGGVRERPRLTPRGAPRRAIGGASRGGGAGDRGRSGLVTISHGIRVQDTKELLLFRPGYGAARLLVCGYAADYLPQQENGRHDADVQEAQPHDTNVSQSSVDDELGRREKED